MAEPITDGLDIDTEQFGKDVVGEYLKNKRTFKRYPLRHYNQLEVRFDEDEVSAALKKLLLPTIGVSVTVFGGYTGQFADCLRKLGMKVVFTDPLKEWVANARNRGFEAYNYAVEEIPSELMKRTELFATFECYQPFNSSRSSNYTTLRMLTAKYGMLFVESGRTRKELRTEADHPLLMIKSSFLSFTKVYSIMRLFRGKQDGLRFYHFSASEEARQKISQDCRVVKLLYDSFPKDARLDQKEFDFLAKQLGLSKREAELSVVRVWALYRLGLPRFMRSIEPDEEFTLFSKTFTVPWNDKDFSLNSM